MQMRDMRGDVGDQRLGAGRVGRVGGGQEFAEGGREFCGCC